MLFKSTTTLLSTVTLLALNGCGGGGDNTSSTQLVGSATTNQAPVASNIVLSASSDAPVYEDSTYSITLNATDDQDSTLNYTLLTQPSHGSIALTDGVASYTPETNYNGEDSFSFQACDSQGLCSNEATVSIEVVAVNDAPVGNDDSATTDEDTSVTIDVLSNDSDVEGDDLTITNLSTPSNGTVKVEDGKLLYTPNENFNGTDSFTYTPNDGSTDGNSVTVSITVNAVNDAPVADAKDVELDEDKTLDIAMSGSDVDGDDLTFKVKTAPEHGTYEDGTYTPEENYNGTDSFTYVANDGTVDSEEVNVTITIDAVNDAPSIVLPPLHISFEEHTIDTNLTYLSYTNTLDMDGDGDLDIVTASYENDQVVWYENNGAQDFTEHNISTTLEYAWSVSSVDIDHDGDIDVLVGAFGDGSVWYENDGNQNFTEHNITTEATWNIAYSDIDQDGVEDVLVGAWDLDQILWYRNEDNGSFSEHNISTLDNPTSAQGVDMDLDDDIDIIATGIADDQVVWYENNGQNHFIEHNITTALNEAYSTFTVDIDDDGDMDVVAAGWRRVALYINQGDMLFEEQNLSTPNTKEYVGTYALDIDEDGDIDIFTSKTWYENNGTGGFDEHQVSKFAPYFSMQDIDEDGDMDIASPIYYDGNLTWQENRGKDAIYVDENSSLKVATLEVSDVDSEDLDYLLEGADASLFDFNLSTGELSFKVLPDFENPDDNNSDNIYRFSVTIDDGELNTTSQLRVIVDNIDDED